MFRRILAIMAVPAVFLAGSYAEGRFHFTPVVTAVCRTLKIIFYDLYSGLIGLIPGEIDTASAFVALAGLLALFSFRYLARARRYWN